MIERLSDFFPLILISILAALVFAPITLRFANRFGWVDRPESAPHKQHIIPTPVTGGLIIGFAILIGYAVLQPMMDVQVMAMLLGGTLVLIIGLIDDSRGLRPSVKLICQLIAAGILIYFGIRIQITRIEWFDLLLTLLWVVGVTNAFNFVDSMDGLTVGLGIIAAVFFILATIDSTQPVLTNLTSVVAGASVGFFIYNATPAKIFLGDSGAMLIGFLLAGIGIAYVPAQAGLPQGLTWFIPILVLGVPIFDTTLVFVSRLRRHRPVYRASRDHTYHRLVQMGLDPSRAVLAMQMTAIVIGLVAFIALDTTVMIANLLFASIVLSGILLIVVFEKWAAVREY